MTTDQPKRVIDDITAEKGTYVPDNDVAKLSYYLSNRIKIKILRVF